MHIFLFEFVTGGGFLSAGDQPMPVGSLLTEGEAMWRALRDDLSCIQNVEVHSLRDARLPSVDQPGVSAVAAHMRESFFGLAINCDMTLILAPEFDLHLENYTSSVEALGAKLLSPNAQFISVAGNKTATARALTAQGVSVPYGKLLSHEQTIPVDFTLPAVLKANDGAGSMAEIVHSRDVCVTNGVMRVEQLVSGINCSISFFCRGDRSPIACPPMQQILSDNNSLEFTGGKRLMDRNLVERATRIGHRAIGALPPTIGYVGIDLVLGDKRNGDEDFVIEVNPRVTTSYLGLREIAKSNLTEAMIEIATGKQPTLEFSDRSVHFLADGTIL